MRVAVNSSPLIFLAKLGLLNILNELFEEVYITDAVYYETVVEGVAHEEALDIAKASFLKRVSVDNQKLVKFLLELVDYGEAETIAFAIENQGSEKSCGELWIEGDWDAWNPASCQKERV